MTVGVKNIIIKQNVKLKRNVTARIETVREGTTEMVTDTMIVTAIDTVTNTMTVTVIDTVINTMRNNVPQVNVETGIQLGIGRTKMKREIKEQTETQEEKNKQTRTMNNTGRHYRLKDNLPEMSHQSQRSRRKVRRGRSRSFQRPRFLRASLPRGTLKIL